MDAIENGLGVVEFVPHDSRPQFRTLNHSQLKIINSEPESPVLGAKQPKCGYRK
jgi:hypothetical protein